MWQFCVAIKSTRPSAHCQTHSVHVPQCLKMFKMAFFPMLCSQYCYFLIDWYRGTHCELYYWDILETSHSVLSQPLFDWIAFTLGRNLQQLKSNDNLSGWFLSACKECTFHFACTVIANIPGNVWRFYRKKKKKRIMLEQLLICTNGCIVQTDNTALAQQGGISEQSCGTVTPLAACWCRLLSPWWSASARLIP